MYIQKIFLTFENIFMILLNVWYYKEKRLINLPQRWQQQTIQSSRFGAWLALCSCNGILTNNKKMMQLINTPFQYSFLIRFVILQGITLSLSGMDLSLTLLFQQLIKFIHVLQKGCSYKFRKIRKKTPALNIHF